MVFSEGQKVRVCELSEYFNFVVDESLACGLFVEVIFDDLDADCLFAAASSPEYLSSAAFSYFALQFEGLSVYLNK
jgi:hypothetical protein